MAVREIDRAMSLDKYAPFIDQSLFFKGQALEALKQNDRAMDCYKKLVEDHPTSNLAVKAKEKIK